MLGGPADGLPPLPDAHLAVFWQRFDAAAPLHVRAGFALATTVLARVLPRLLGHRGGIGSLPPAAQDQVLAAGARLPGGSALIDVTKLVASFAYFSDAAVDAAFREGLR